MTGMIQGSSIYSQAAAIVAGFGPLLWVGVGTVIFGWIMLSAFGLIGHSSAARTSAGRGLAGASAGRGLAGGSSGGLSSVRRGRHSRGSARAARSGPGSGSIYRTKASWGRPSQVVTSEAIVDALSKPSTMLKPLDYGGGPGAGPTKTA